MPTETLWLCTRIGAVVDQYVNAEITPPRCVNNYNRALTDLHGNTNCALGRFTDVVGVPSDTDRNVGINSAEQVSYSGEKK